VFPISGRAPNALRPKHDEASAPIHALHGTNDPLIDISYARDALRGINDNFHFMDLHEFEGVGHHISNQMRADLYQQLSRLVSQ
jgi:predicted esterase